MRIKLNSDKAKASKLDEIPSNPFDSISYRRELFCYCLKLGLA